MEIEAYRLSLDLLDQLRIPRAAAWSALERVALYLSPELARAMRQQVPSKPTKTDWEAIPPEILR